MHCITSGGIPHTNSTSQIPDAAKHRMKMVQTLMGPRTITHRFQEEPTARTVVNEKFMPPRTSMASYFMTKVDLLNVVHTVAWVLVSDHDLLDSVYSIC